MWLENLPLTEVLLCKEQIAQKVAELGRQISVCYAGKELFLVVVLKGACVFAADLMRGLDLPLTLDFVILSSYGGGESSSGKIRIDKDLAYDIRGKHVLIVEDIIDSGLTIKSLRDLLNAREPASLKICSLLDKPSRRQVPITADFCGFTIEDKFVVGYGLDYAEEYRHLPFIGVLKAAAVR